MSLADLLMLCAAVLVLASEFKNFKRDELLSKFVLEAHIISDRLDAIEKTILKLLEK
jgi:hypothetical protein